MPFQDDLVQFGPRSARVVSREEAWAYCAKLTAEHYENFSVVTWLTPRDLRPAFQSIYSFCRWSDDLGDETGDPHRALELLEWWRESLIAAVGGEAVRHPVLITLVEVISEYQIPLGPFLALISAFEQDQRITEYQNLDQLLEYCTRSANPVGHLVLYLAKAFSAENARLADQTCTGLQLANFWQDVARDLEIGRIYLPREDRARFGYTDDDLRARRFTPAFGELLRHEVATARRLLDAGAPLARRLPWPISLDVELFNRGGQAILDGIVARGYDVWSQRPTVSKLAKLSLLMRAVWTQWTRRKDVA